MCDKICSILIGVVYLVMFDSVRKLVFPVADESSGRLNRFKNPTSHQMFMFCRYQNSNCCALPIRQTVLWQTRHKTYSSHCNLLSFKLSLWKYPNISRQCASHSFHWQVASLFNGPTIHSMFGWSHQQHKSTSSEIKDDRRKSSEFRVAH